MLNSPDTIPWAATSSVGVFICSSDTRKDVLTRILPSLFKFWPDCTYPLYLGLNTPDPRLSGIKTLVAERSSWRRETLAQISQIPETHLILLLDDFLVRGPVDQGRMDKHVSTALKSDLPYLRLLPLRKSIFERMMAPSTPDLKIIKIKDGRPFYSSLQIAIWNKSHLASLLEGQGSIWEFEHHRKAGVDHFAITDGTPIFYSHLVEKGRWLPYASRLLREAGIPSELGARPVWPQWMNLRVLLDEVRFLLFGYANH